MELRHLRYFTAVAEELHFSRAAEKLGISPPALTEQIQSLERELGVRLLLRSRRAVSLTDAGVRFLEEARIILKHAKHAEVVARQAGRGEIGRVEIGYVSTAAFTGFLSEAVMAYRRAYPLVNVSIRKMETSKQLEQLTDGRLHIGLLRPPSRFPVGISGLLAIKQSVVVALRSDHRLASMNLIAPSMLENEPFIAPNFELELGIYQHTAEVGQKGGFTPRIVDRGPDNFAIVTKVAAGFGIAIVPEFSACLQIPDVVFRPLSQKMRPAEIVAAFRRDERAPAVKAFVEQLRKLTQRQNPVQSLHVIEREKPTVR